MIFVACQQSLFAKYDTQKAADGIVEIPNVDRSAAIKLFGVRPKSISVIFPQQDRLVCEFRNYSLLPMINVAIKYSVEWSDEPQAKTNLSGDQETLAFSLPVNGTAIFTIVNPEPLYAAVNFDRDIAVTVPPDTKPTNAILYRPVLFQNGMTPCTIRCENWAR